MGVVDGYNSSVLQFVVDALRTQHAPAADLTTASGRRMLHAETDRLVATGRPAIRNPNGTALTVAQIATAANLTSAQVQDIAGRL